MKLISALAAGLLVALAVLAAPTALAQDDSAIDQYVEGVPEAGGDSNDGGGNGGGNDGVPLPSDTASDLQAQGADGAAVADLAEETAPDSASTVIDEGNGESADPAVGDGSGGAGSDPAADAPITADGSSDGSKAGVGAGLPIFIALTLIGAIGFVLWRRRTQGQPDSA